MVCFRPGDKAPNEVVGKPAEVQVAGGEVAFARKMVEESKALQDQVGIYTILLGHKSSVAEVKKVLHTTSTRLARMCQKKFTRYCSLSWP